jgi:hypothetical protein
MASNHFPSTRAFSHRHRPIQPTSQVHTAGLQACSDHSAFARPMGDRRYQRAAGCLYSMDRTSSLCRWSGRIDYEKDNADCRRLWLDAVAQWLHGHLLGGTLPDEAGARHPRSTAREGRGLPRSRPAAPAVRPSSPSGGMAITIIHLHAPPASCCTAGRYEKGRERFSRPRPVAIQLTRPAGVTSSPSTDPTCSRPGQQ